MDNALKYITLAAAIILLMTSPAHALSCAMPQMSAEVVEGSAVIFEGEVTQKRELTETERESLIKQGLATKGGDMANVKAYEFKVLRGWKNAEEGQTVLVLRNTYWGDGFATEGAYLVVARDYGGFYEAPLCGNTLPSQSATDQIDFLLNYNEKAE